MICCFKGNFRITSPRGERILCGKKEFHKGIDMVGMDDITVYSVCDGVATTGFQANGAGNYIVVTMSDGRRVLYMHLAKFLIKNGKSVKKGEPIGIMGNTGNSYGAHTHIELRPAGSTCESLDVSEFLKIENRIGIYYYNPNVEKEENNMSYEQFEEYMDKYIEKLKNLEPSEWSEDERKFCESHGLIKGDGKGKYGYMAPVTKEELAVVSQRIVTGLVNNFGSKER